MGKNLTDAISQLNKTYGEGTILRGESVPSVGPRIKSGSIDLDIALNGGYAKGRIVEIYGPESSGKTTLTLHAIANEQKNGGIAAFIDFEHSFDREYAQALGIDLEELIFVQPTTAEEGLEILDRLIRTGEVSLTIVDSVAAMVPKSELDGEMGDQSIGKHAKLMSQAMRKLTGIVSQNECCCIFINQLREKIGVMFGSPETTTGGNALKFYASQRLDIRGGVKVVDSSSGSDILIGTETKVKVVKNKVGSPHKIATFLIEYGRGILRERDILRKSVELKIVNKAGSWFNYGETKLGQGENKVVRLLMENVDLADELESEIIKNLSNVEN